MSERILSALVVVVAILATIPAVAEAVPYAGRGGPHPLDRFGSQLRWNPGS